MQRLYGILARVEARGVIVGKEIFKEEGKEEYYSFIHDEDGRRVGIETVDVTRYGATQNLPVSAKDIREGNELLILWQKTKCLHQNELLNPCIAENTEAKWWLCDGIRICICDNKKFIICEAKSPMQMEQLYRLYSK